MLGGVFAFSSLAVSGRSALVEHDTFEIMLWRSLSGLVLLLLWIVITGRRDRVRLARPGLHLARSGVHFAGQNLWFLAIGVLPLAQVLAIEFTMPVWVLLLAPLVLGERITRTGVIVTALGLAGVLIVTRPGLQAVGTGHLAAAGAAIGFALSAMFTRRLTRSESVLSVLLWMHVIQAVLALVCAGADGRILLPQAGTALPLFLLGLGGLVAHGCLTAALSLAPAAQVIPVDFLRLPLMAAVGALLYAEPLDPFVLAGGAVILLANWLNLRAPRPAEAPPPRPEG